MDNEELQNSLEKNIQERFFDNLITQEDSFQKTPINVYQKLVYMRFEEVIKSNFPLFIKEISEVEFEKTVVAFMQDTPSTPFVWKIPNDYRKFVKRNKLFKNREYLYELLYYDWIETEIYMKEYKFKEHGKFKFSNSYKISPSSRVKSFSYDIIGNDYQSKRENFVVIYYDFNSHDVLYREINQLIYILIKRLNKKQNLGKVLKEICLENDIDFKEAKKVLKEPLQELYDNLVFI